MSFFMCNIREERIHNPNLYCSLTHLLLHGLIDLNDLELLNIKEEYHNMLRPVCGFNFINRFFRIQC